MKRQTHIGLFLVFCIIVLALGAIIESVRPKNGTSLNDITNFLLFNSSITKTNDEGSSEEKDLGEPVTEATPVALGEAIIDIRTLDLINSDWVELHEDDSFSFGDEAWIDTIEFYQFYNRTCFMEYDLQDKFSVLQFRLTPILKKERFDEGSVAELHVIDMGSSKIIYKTDIDYNSGVIEAAIDVSGVKRIRIEMIQPSEKNKGNYANCLMKDVLLYPSGMEPDGLKLNTSDEDAETEETSDNEITEE